MTVSKADMPLTLSQIVAAILGKTVTGFAPHPEKAAYHGFTCPVCGRHEFGTSPLPGGVSVGHCHGHQHSGNGCTFSWDRNNAADEANVMHTQTEEEWAASFNQ